MIGGSRPRWWLAEAKSLTERAGMIGLPAEVMTPPTPRLIARLITSSTSDKAPTKRPARSRLRHQPAKMH